MGTAIEGEASFLAEQMEFLEAASDWADHVRVDIKFFRDEYDGWTAHVPFNDSKGPYSATIGLVTRRPKKAAHSYQPMKNKKPFGDPIRKPAQPAETLDDYRERVFDLMSKACAQAHASRRPKQQKPRSAETLLSAARAKLAELGA